MPYDLYYKVLLNGEGQYCIWPEMKSPPLGWREAGPAGSKDEVLDWIRANWTDMRPVSMEADAPTDRTRSAR